LTLSVFQNRSLTTIVLASHLVEARGTQISARTVRRVLHESDLSSYKPVACSKLTADHRGSRRRFEEHHINWTIQQWSSVMFSDESHFCLRMEENWRMIYTLLHFTRKIFRWWWCNGVSGYFFRAHRINFHLTSDRYIRQYLDAHVVVPYAPFVGENFLFMHENACPHTAGIARDC
jgi:hypothetical protein